MKKIIVPSLTSNILFVKLYDSSSTTGAGLTGLTSASAGLIISTACDNEATATAYTQAGGTIETIATLGTYAAPTATKCRFKEYDPANHKGVYQVMLADARFAISGAQTMLLSISGAANLAQYDAEIQFGSVLPPSSATNFYNAYNGVGYTDGTCQAGVGNTSTAVILSAGASATDNYYKGMMFQPVGGTGGGQRPVFIESYDGTTKIATIKPSFITTCDGTTTYVLVPFVDPFRSIVIESAGSITAQAALSLIVSAAFGEWTADGTFKTPDGTATRIAGTAASVLPFRSAVTLTPSV